MLPQRRHDQVHDGEPIVEVLAKAAGAGLLHEIAVGAGDDAHVDALHLSCPDWLDLALLQRAQQLRLHRQGKLADLVEHERAPVSLREESTACLRRARERAAHVAEQLRLCQISRNGGAVEAHQRSRGPMALGVHE